MGEDDHLEEQYELAQSGPADYPETEFDYGPQFDEYDDTEEEEE